MTHSLGLAFLVWSAVSQAGAGQQTKAVVSGLKNPESVVVTPQGQVFVSVMGEADRDRDGAVLKVNQGKAVPFCFGIR